MIVISDAAWSAVGGICTTLTTLILLICVHRVSSTWNAMMDEMLRSRLVERTWKPHTTSVVEECPRMETDDEGAGTSVADLMASPVSDRALVAAILMDQFVGMDDRLVPLDHRIALSVASKICDALGLSDTSRAELTAQTLERLTVIDPFGVQFLQNPSSGTRRPGL
jgi:hypothetical protein